MLKHKTGERFTDDETDIEGKARRWSRSPARAFQKSDMVRVVEDDVPGKGIRYHLLEVFQLDVFVDGDETGGSLQRNDFSVVRVGKADPVALSVRSFGRSRYGVAAFKPPRQPLKAVGERMFADGDADVEIRPAKIEVRVQFIEP